MAQYTVYCHKNKLNNKRYIGMTSTTPTQRWGSNGVNYHNCRCFNNAIKKYGWNNFEHIILKENLTQEEAVFWEKYYIQLYNTITPYGYNLTDGGEIKKQISEETRQRLRDSHLGYKLSEATKQKMSKSRKGHPGYNRKAVWMCDKKTHKRIRQFESMHAAGEFLNNQHANSHIGKVCNKQQASAYGYFWEYVQEGDIYGDA